MKLLLKTVPPIHIDTKLIFMVRLFLIVGATSLLLTCHQRDSNNLSDWQNKQPEAAYDSLEVSYNVLIEEYKAIPDTIPVDLHTLYIKMQRMHQQMDISYEKMMSINIDNSINEKRMPNGKMMGHILGLMNGEWYCQMMRIHNRIAKMHEEIGQQSLAEMNKQLADKYRKIMEMIKSTEPLSDEIEESSFLDRKNFNSQYCSSCHGSSGILSF